MNKLIQKFIVWYLKRHSVKFDCGKYVVRMFSADYYYSNLMDYAKLMNGINCKCAIYPVFDTQEGEE